MELGMYTIVGGDGREYGPVTAEQVRAWMADGRASLQTRVRAEGSDTWSTIADHPGLSGVSVAPNAPWAGPAAPLDILGCYARSWELLKAHFWPLVGVSFLMSLLMAGLVLAQRIPYLYFLSLLFAGVIIGGWYYYFLKKIRGESATVADAFGGVTRAFGNLVAAGILVGTFTFLGFIALVIPGIYLAVAYGFTYLLATDRRLGFWEAMETSRRTITRQWFRVFGLFLLSIPFILLGIAALGVGLLVVMPLVIGAQAYAYEDLCNPRRPSVTPSSP
jgi:hypothetical protein